MPLELGTYISDLVVTNPASADNMVDGDDHLRLIKNTIKNTFPNVTGPVTATQTELNDIVGATSSLQAQINADVANVATLTASALPKAGGTMTGPIVLSADPAAPLQPATKQYTDASTKTAAQISDGGAVGRSLLQSTTALIATALLSVFGASGASHAAGLVPDPGSSAGTTRYLREDSSWQAVVGLSAATVVATTSTSAIAGPVIPSTARRITILLQGVGTTGTNPLSIRIGTGGAPTTSGYLSTAMVGSSPVTATNAFTTTLTGASVRRTGKITIELVSANTWVEAHTFGDTTSGNVSIGGGQVTLAGTLNYVEIDTLNADTFSAGNVSFFYE